MTRNNPPEQLSLLDWVPPNPVVRFDPRLVRANRFTERLSRTISARWGGSPRRAACPAATSRTCA
ncbi:hypothetical protein NO263_02190 [Gluconacetobacter entanii]|uniref:Uncharacterized protein n=1 Tax=Gluconacetobacter entanii TaxID=108528 RepID=A0ABT3K1W7_9PROT|nr:hypothetical protein [Gluconacetobacter entanii]MCW4589397.1 hypothetical protein [Gluconacetobacter entanii]MCW4592513.1 hypothetical protein [Gluconacetobacter entanii]NPC87632.1 hypothetical protein [Gluconacetobacter entanii]